MWLFVKESGECCALEKSGLGIANEVRKGRSYFFTGKESVAAFKSFSPGLTYFAGR